MIAITNCKRNFAANLTVPKMNNSYLLRGMILSLLIFFFFNFSSHAIVKGQTEMKNLDALRTIKGPKLTTTWGLELDVVAWPEQIGKSLFLHFSVFENGKAFNNKDIFTQGNRGLKNAFPTTNNGVSSWNSYYFYNKTPILAQSYEVLKPEKGSAIITWNLKNGGTIETFSMVIRTSEFLGKYDNNSKTLPKIKIKQKNVQLLKEKLVNTYKLRDPKIWDRPHIQIVPSNYDQIRNVSYETLKRMTGDPLPNDYQFLKGEVLYISDSKILKVLDVLYKY